MKIKDAIRRVANIGYPIEIKKDRINVKGDLCTLVVTLIPEIDQHGAVLIKDNEGWHGAVSLLDGINQFMAREKFVKITRRQAEERSIELIKQWSEI